MTIKVSLGKRKQYFGKIEMLRCNKRVSKTECRLCVSYFSDVFKENRSNETQTTVKPKLWNRKTTINQNYVCLMYFKAYTYAGSRHSIYYIKNKALRLCICNICIFVYIFLK